MKMHRYWLVLACAMPVLAQAQVTYGNTWSAGGAQTYSHQLQAPAGPYRLDIQSTGNNPVAVYNRFQGSSAAPILRLNANGQARQGSVEIELKATKPGLAFGYVPIEVKVGTGKTVGAGAYTIQIVPLF